MSISDEMMWRYYELCTDLTPVEIESKKSTAQRNSLNPRDLKVELAKRIVSDFYSSSDANEAEEEFVRRFRNKEIPDQVEEVSLALNREGWDLSELLVGAGLAASKGEARRLIQQGGVSVDGERQTNTSLPALGTEASSVLLKVGKRRFVRVFFKS